jgi:predicted AAA+ superfamily ATPase
MKRDLLIDLVEWKNSEYRKPMLLRGARQTGKTWLLKEFGRLQYKYLVYCNFEEDPLLDTFFESSLHPEDILQKISVFKKTEIHPKDSFIIFDEIQLSKNALTSLKYFSEETPEYHIAAAGSLLGLKVSRPASFPVGKVDILDIHPMCFGEFLSALGEQPLRDFLASIASIEPIPLPFHEKLVELLKTFYIVGGMPEAVARYVGTRSFAEVRTVLENILALYKLDFAKHAPKEDIPRLSIIWDSIPAHLSRENKKFIFSALASTARSRSFESALQWLSDAGLIHRAYALDHVEMPIAGFAERNIFKVYALDTGLLAAQAKIPVDLFVRGNELFHTFHGAFVENFVAQHLVNSRISPDSTLHYWKSESRKAEVDFLIQSGNEILPLEVKAGINPKSKSLQSYNERYKPKALLRTTLLNLMKNGPYINIPLYAIGNLGPMVKSLVL